MVEPHAVLEIADGVLDLGVAAMGGLQFQGVAVSVGDETVVAAGGKHRELGTGHGFHPPYDELHRYGVGLAGEGCVAGLGYVGDAFHPIWDGRPVRRRYGFDQIAQGLVLAYGDGEADTLIAAGGHNRVSIKAAVGPHGQRFGGSGVAHSADGLPQEMGGAPRPPEADWIYLCAVEPSIRRPFQ